MKKKDYKPYGIDIKKELKLYKRIGLRHKKDALKKRLKRRQEKYLVYNTYSEWANHVRGIIRKDIRNYEDFLRWLNWKRRGWEGFLDLVKVLIIPIYILLLSLERSFQGVDMLSLLMALIISTFVYEYASDYLYFLIDFIEIAEKENPNGL